MENKNASLLAAIDNHLATTTNRNRYASITKTNLWKPLLDITSYLPDTHTVSQRVWHLRNGCFKPNPGCALCKGEVRYDHGLCTYRICCSSKCHAVFNNDRRKETNITRYGVPTPAHRKEVRDKMQETTFNRHGVYNISSLPSTKQKKEDKAMARYGVKNVSHAPEVRAKISAYRQGMSIEQIVRLSDLQIRTAKKFRDYVFPSGRVVMIQGYEDKALDLLIKTIPDKNILVEKSNVPVIRYCFRGKNRIHFPDIFIADTNLIIEVKSTFTFSHHRELNMAKKEAALSSGFQYEIWVFDAKGNLEKY